MLSHINANTDPLHLFAQTPALQHKVFIGLPAGVKIKGVLSSSYPTPPQWGRVSLSDTAAVFVN